MMRKVEIRQSDKINSALTYGLFRPVVLLPKITDWEDERKINYILTHEYVHIRKFDIVYKWLFAAVVCIHWFNPFVWIMYLLANRDIELACDETVVQKLGLNARASYACMLIEMQERKGRSVLLANCFSKNAFEERTVSIMKTKKVTFSGVVAAFVVGLCTVSVFATNSVSSTAVEAAIAGQEGYSGRDNVSDCSTDCIKWNNIELTDGISPEHEVNNGHMVIYKYGENGWNLTKGKTVKLQISIEDILADGQTAVLGYIVDHTYTDIFSGKLKGDKTVEFTIPDDGEYMFYIIGASSDTIYIQSFEVI